MRVNEILAENKKQINEVVPLIGGVGVGAAMAAISAVIAGWTLVELVQFVSKYNEDPDQVTDEQWKSILFDILLIAVPGLAGKAIKRLIPDSVKTRLSNWLKNKILNRYRELNRAKADKAIGRAHGRAGPPRVAPPSEVRKFRAKERLANIKARAKADKLVASMPSKLKAVFAAGIGLNIAHDYYSKISLLDEYWAEYESGTMSEDNFFKGATQQEAIDTYNRLKRQYLGELVSTLGVAFAALPIAKATSTVGSLFGKGFIGGPINLGAQAVAKLLQVVGNNKFSFLLFTQTKTGQDLLANSLSSVMQGVGTASVYILDLVDKFVKEVNEKYGTNIPAEPSLKDTPANTAAAQISNKDYVAAAQKIPFELRKTTDPNNPKIIYIGGVQFTDKDGYQSVSDQMINHIKQSAAAIKIPDPTQGITKKL